MASPLELFYKKPIVVEMAQHKTGVLIQARSNSSRLPGKIYAGLPEPGSLSQIEHIVHRMQKVGADVTALVIPRSDLVLVDFCEKRGLEYFCGSEEDVRDRYRRAAFFYGIEYIVRATGDNPCVDVGIARESLETLIRKDLDLFSFQNLPLGMAVEAFTTSALLREAPSEPSSYREHVSLHIKHNPERFSFEHQDHPIMDAFVCAAPRMTVDTPEDLAVVRGVFERLGADFGVAEVMQLYIENPELFLANETVEQLSFAAPY